MRAVAIWTDLRRRTISARQTAAVRTHQWVHDRRGHVEFIHINKSGGSSVEKALGLPFSHQTAAMRVARLGVEEWRRRYSFTFVRNPWDKMVSQYHFRQGRGRLHRDVEFREWIRATLLDGDEELMFRRSMFINQLDWISGTSGEVLVDDIYRFESLHDDFARLCRRLGVDASLPHDKPSAHRHFSEYYDAATADIVGTAFQRDIEFFDYQLDQP